jgi:hypothetical protein
MANAMGVRTEAHKQLEDAERDVAPDAVLDEIEKYDVGEKR